MKIFALLFVFASVFGGYMWGGGKIAPILHVLPHEGLTIIGAAIGAFVIANPSYVVRETLQNMKCLIKPEAHDKGSYMELLSILYMIFKLARTKGWLALEQHIEHPEESELFKQFPDFSGNHHATIFLCDYLRIISLGNENPHELEALMDEEIETISHHEMHPSHAVQTMADGIPALGIVAAVLGVIKTMGSITEPPEILGKMIGGALVGTFLGVFVAYGMVGPSAGALGSLGESRITYYRCIKVAVLAFLNGSAPQVAVEFARKFLPPHVQPSFLELEDKLNALPSPG